ncbi:hypothetical protein BU25DRAFT_494418 [Macroventuria anomochaeta]|uniref:Uncharacterized protein n=1 Tax=Macroventuria anomochaeta TaxID=301207 RepID=A0ACB6RP65_9PLEO|nr:uncharacterized protein BU25DRAFT_494418 [Macroventuria anomochaeta]KAF2623200.1 hypothetical protein BU25DRAFT_494418 [Macroventuria anomochaeta]
MDASTTGAAKRKHRPGLQRVSIACERCRSRKHKCDRKLPECSTCLAAGAECVVLDRTTHRQYPRGHVEDMEAQMLSLRTRLEEVEHENTTLKQDLESARRRNAPGETPRAPSLESGTPNATTNTSSASPFGSLLDEINLVPSDVTSGQRFVGDSSGLFFGKIMQAVLLQADYKGEQGPASDALRLRVADRTGTTASETIVSVPPFEYPDLDVAHRLQNAYHTCRWPALPFLHWPAFLNNHFGPVMASPMQASDVSRFITLMVLSLGAIDLKRQDKSIGEKHLAYFQHATTHYLDGLLKDDSVETVQGLLLVAQFAVNEHRSANAWLVIGQAIRTAVDLGLHRLQPATFDLYKSEMRKRVFWAAYALDRNISITLGRPCAIRDEDIDIPLPSNLTDARLLTGDDLFEGAFAPNHPLDMSTFIHIIQLRQLQSNIQSLFYAADTTYTQAGGTQLHQANIRARLEDWISRSPRYTQSTMATFQSTEWFQIAYSHALLLLYRPSPASPVVDAAALQTCADSAIGLISSYSTLYAKNKITYTWIALHGLFMASVTMLYTLNVSHDIRSSTTKTVVRSNIASCLALFQVMAKHWPLAIRCHDIIERLGNATLALFDAPPQELPAASASGLSQQHFGQIDTEFMNWFGTRDGQLEFSFEDLRHDLEQDAMVSDHAHAIDDTSNPIAGAASLPQDLANLFSVGFDTTLPMMMTVFGNESRDPIE